MRKTIWSIALALGILSPGAQAGNGTFASGVYNFCVSVRFNATAAELANIQTAFTGANQSFADATDAQQRWGRITIVNNSGCSESAEFWVNPGNGRANASAGLYGVRGQHIMMYYRGQTNGSGDDMANPTGAGVAFTLAHEMAHHSFAVRDEYSGPGGDAVCALRSLESASLGYSLMDNYFSRGGRSGGGTTYTLKEFCVRANHDPSDVTWQSAKNRNCGVQNNAPCSVWETIAKSKRPATAPALPNFAVPTVAAPTFQTSAGGLRVIIVIDRSGSMLDEQRLVFAKQASGLFINALQVGDQVGVVSFADSASVMFPLTQIASQTTKNGAISAINSLVANGATGIGNGLSAALSQITAANPRSCDEVIVLLTDGDHNSGPEPSTVVPSIKAEGVAVLTVGVGASITASGQAVLQSVATQTGGKYFGLSSSLGLVSLFFQIWAESTGNGILANSPLALTPNVRLNTPIRVEQGSRSVTFGIAAVNPNALNIELRAPNNAIYASDAAVTGAGGTVDRTSANAVLYTFPNPQTGDWNIGVLSGTATQAELFAGSVNDATKLMVNPETESVQSPNPMLITATPEFNGRNLINATVAGRVLRPDGSAIPISFTDDASNASGDGQPGDGVYSAKFNAFNANGTYTVQLTASGNMSFTLGELFGSAPGTPVAAPAMVRTSSASFIVTGVDPCALSIIPIGLNAPASGDLNSFSCVFSNRTAQTYSFAGTAGQQISISMDSTIFDTFLYLVSPTGTILASDDDSGTGTNSRIPAGAGVFTLPSTGTYRVMAAAFSGSGAFTIVVNGAINPPGAPTNLSPPDNTNGMPLKPALEWTAGAGATSYDVYFGTSSNPPLVTNIAGTTYSPGTLSASTRYYWRIVARNAGGVASSATLSFVTGTGVAPPSQFVRVSPCRVADTRGLGFTGAFGTPFLTGGVKRDFPIPAGVCGIPSTALGYSLNVTVVPRGRLLGYLSIWPTAQSQPVVSTLNALDGGVTANAAIVPAGLNGAVSVFVTEDSEVILDINGYFTPPGGSALAFYPVAPCRITDTRNAGGIINARATRTIAVRTAPCGIPATAQSYSLNMTVVPQGPLGFLTTWPTGQSQPTVSTLNALDGSVVANAAIVPAGTNGAIDVYVTDATHLVVDVNGYYAPPGQPGALSFYPVPPCRIADTRSTSNIVGQQTRGFNIPASGCGVPAAAAYSLNMTVVPPGQLFYLTTWPTGIAQPLVSTLNSPLGKILANAAVVPAGSGSIDVFVSHTTHVVIDVNGYFAP